MDIGDAKITINADDKASAKLQNVSVSLDQMGKKATIAGAAMLAAGVALAAGLFKMADSYTKAGDEIAKMSKRTGIATEELSIMRHIAGLSGTSLESVEKGIKRMASTLEDAKDGLETYTKSFDKLGLSIEDIVDMSPEEQFWAISEAIAAIEDPTERAALAQDMFGRAGTDLLPILADGKEGVDEMRESAEQYATIYSVDAAEASEHFQDSIFELKQELAKLGNQFIDDLLPTLEIYIQKAKDVVEQMGVWTEEHPELAKQLLTLAGILGVGGAVLLAFGAVAKAIVAINAALIIMRALSGPKGWIELAAGLAIAGGAIYAVNKLMQWQPGMEEVEMPEVPAMQSGGIVPGPFGQPTPIMAHGGELVSGLHGEAMGTTVNISMGNYLGDEGSLREFVRMLKDVIGQDTRRTSFAGVNKLGYYPGSSAP